MISSKCKSDSRFLHIRPEKRQEQLQQANMDQDVSTSGGPKVLKMKSVFLLDALLGSEDHNEEENRHEDEYSELSCPEREKKYNALV